MATDPSYVARIRDKYNGIDDVWAGADAWHAWSRRQIEAELAIVAQEYRSRMGDGGLVVDVGSAGDSYLGPNVATIDVDIAERGLKYRPLPVCCSAETLAIRAAVADLVVCVGPVVNYCSLEEVVEEAARIARPGGDYVLHVELSNSLEFAGSPSWRRDVAFVRSFYRGAEDYWVYSDRFARRILARSGFSARRTRYFHLASSIVLRITRNADLASRFGRLDRYVSRLPLSAAWADSAIYVCRRAA